MGIDNLKPDASASEMEQAIREHQDTQAEPKLVKPELDKPEPKVETPEPAAPEAVETPGPEQPKDKFGGDPAKLQKSYDESVKWNTKLSQEIAELKRGQQEIRERTQAQPRQPEITQDQLKEWHERDPIGCNQWIAAQTVEAQIKGLNDRVDRQESNTSNITAKTAVEHARRTLDGFADLEGEIMEDIKTLPPGLLNDPRNFDPALEHLYYRAKGKKMDEYVTKAREEGRLEAQAKAKEKKEAYVEGSGKVTPEKPFDADKASAQEILEMGKAMGIPEKG